MPDQPYYQPDKPPRGSTTPDMINRERTFIADGFVRSWERVTRLFKRVIGVEKKTDEIQSLTDPTFLAAGDARWLSASTPFTIWDAIVSSGPQGTHTSLRQAIIDGNSKILVLDGPVNDRGAGSVTITSKIEIHGADESTTPIAWLHDGLTLNPSADGTVIRHLRMGDGGTDSTVLLNSSDDVLFENVQIYSQNSGLVIRGVGDVEFRDMKIWATSTFPAFTPVNDVPTILFDDDTVSPVASLGVTFRRLECRGRISDGSDMSTATAIRIDASFGTSVQRLLIEDYFQPDPGTAPAGAAVTAFGMIFVESGGNSLSEARIHNTQLEQDLSYIIGTDSGALNDILIDGVYSRTGGLHYGVSGTGGLGFGTANSVAKIVIQNVYCAFDSIYHVTSQNATEEVTISDCDDQGLSTPVVPAGLINAVGVASLSGNTQNIVVKGVHRRAGGVPDDCAISGSNGIFNAIVHDCTGFGLMFANSSAGPVSLHFHNVISDRYAISGVGLDDVRLKDLRIINTHASNPAIDLNGSSGAIDWAVADGLSIDSSAQTSGNILEATATGSVDAVANGVVYRTGGAVLNNGWTINNSDAI